MWFSNGDVSMFLLLLFYSRKKKEKIGNRKQNLKKVFLKHVTFCTIVKYNSDDPVLLG